MVVCLIQEQGRSSWPRPCGACPGALSTHEVLQCPWLRTCAFLLSTAHTPLSPDSHCSRPSELHLGLPPGLGSVIWPPLHLSRISAGSGCCRAGCEWDSRSEEGAMGPGV